MTRYLFALLFFLLSFSLIGAEKTKSDKITYEMLERFNSAGKCESHHDALVRNNRYASLLFIQDVLYGVLGKNSYTKDIVGDIGVFKIGRNPDTVLVALYEYAEREDVKEQLNADAKTIGNELERNRRESFKDSNAKNVDDKDAEEVLTAHLCEIYRMLSGKSYYFNDELAGYFESLNKKITSRNINRLREITKDL